MTNPLRPHSGFSAIEMLAAAVLASLLMATLLGVLRGLKTSVQALELRSSASDWQRSFAGVLEADLRNADAYLATSTMLRLTGPCGLTSAGLPTWLPAEVTYEIRHATHGAWLVRRQANAGRLIAEDLALAEVTEIRCGPGTADAAHSLAAGTNMDDAQPLPHEFVIELWGRDARAPLFRHQFRAP